MSINDYAESCETVAREALFQTGALIGCRFHEGVTIRVGDPDKERHAYAIATNKLKADGTIEYMREDVMAAIQFELEQAADECPHCGAD